jgi:hypothetical protein
LAGVKVFLAGFPLLPPKLGKRTMTIRFVEDILDDFLFDCWQANKRLTDEDWQFFGKEEHHLEIPARDGGILHPLNSQFLTTYQHWIAGVLQSEIWGKRCFAFVPKGVLPEMFEMLRVKWGKESFQKGRSHRRDLIRRGTHQKCVEDGKRVAKEKKGIHNPDNEEVVREGCRMGGSIQGRNNVNQKLGVFGWSKEQLSENTKKHQSRKFRCLVTGHTSTATGLTKIQNRLGIDTSLRVQIQ